MEVVKGLVSSGITIAATIHSPTPRTFQLFDRVLILQRGRIVFFGDNGESAKQYFAASPHFEVSDVHGNRIMCDVHDDKMTRNVHGNRIMGDVHDDKMMCYTHNNRIDAAAKSRDS